MTKSEKKIATRAGMMKFTGKIAVLVYEKDTEWH